MSFGDSEDRFYDVASFHPEQAFQLYLKSVLLRMGTGERKTHEIRELLADLYLNLSSLGLAKRIDGFVRKRRRKLSELEEAYYQARYKPVEIHQRRLRGLN